MQRYTKEGISMHYSETGRQALPAINVKVYRGWPDADKIVDQFKCSKEVAEQASQFAYETHQELFWEKAESDAAEHFAPRTVNIYSEGRSGGWLVVEGLPDVKSWDAISVSKWSSFERSIDDSIKYLCSWEVVLDSISANRWAEEGAERYNFIETKSGKTVCIAEANRAATQARDTVLNGETLPCYCGAGVPCHCPVTEER